MPSDPNLLFLAGLGRSGTTALVEVLSAHPRVVLGVERYKRFYPREEPVTRELFTRERFFALDDGMTNVVPANGEEWQVHYDAMAAKWDTAAYVGDKMVSIRMQHVWETLPEARFVCIVRDIEPVAASWEARARTPRIVAAARPGREPGGGPLEPRAPPHPPRGPAAARPRGRGGVRPLLRRPGRREPRQGARVAGLDRVPEIDSAFAQVHATYVEKVAPSSAPSRRDAGFPRRARRT